MTPRNALAALWLVLLPTLCTCAALQSGEVRIPGAAHDDALLLAEGLQIWDEQVGFRRPLAYYVEEPFLNNDTRLGDCTYLGHYRQVRVFPERIRQAKTCEGLYRECFIQVILHELAHAHLDCSDSDHVPNDPTSTLHPFVNPKNLNPRLDPETLRRVKEANP